MKSVALRDLIYNGVAAAALAVVAAGWPDLPRVLTAFTPRPEPVGAAFAIADQIRWGAAVAAAFFLLRAVGFFRLGAFARLRRWLGRGSGRRWMLGIFAVALALRLGYVALGAGPPFSDEAEYDAFGRSLAAGEGYLQDGVPSAFRAVGYPAFLSLFYLLFGPHHIVVLIFQAFSGAATATLVLPLAREFVDEGAARLAAVLIALCPSQVGYTARLFPPVVITAVVVLTALLIIKWRGWLAAAAAGFLAGVGALVVPTVVLLPAVFFGCDVLCRRGWRRALARAALAAAVAAAVIAPWAYRNSRLFGAFVPFTTNGGVNLWVGNNPRASGAYYFPTARTNPVYMTPGELARDRVGFALGWRYIRTARAQFLALMVPKFVYIYGADISAFQLTAAAHGRDAAAAAYGFGARLAQTYYALFWVAFVLALVAYRRRIFAGGARRPPAALLLWPIYLTGVYLVFLGQDRFHFPALPFMAVVAAAAFFPERAAENPIPAR